MNWNVKRITELLPEFALDIQCLRPSKTRAEDTYIWQPSQSGVYATKSGYFTASMATHQSSPTTSPDSFNWRQDVWSGSYSPKMKVFLWSIIQGALPLGENLQKRGILSASNCPRCNERETAVHTFFTCPFAQEVWQLIPLSNAVHIAADSDESFEHLIPRFRQAICPTIRHNLQCSPVDPLGHLERSQPPNFREQKPFIYRGLHQRTSFSKRVEWYQSTQAPQNKASTATTRWKTPSR